MRPPLPSSARRIGAAALAASFAVTLLLGIAATDVSAQTDDTTADTTVQTTSTLPTDNRELGNSLTRPNQGMEPQDAGDPGGWLQQSLFFLICGGIVVIALLVWRSSSRARSARTAAGQDPVSLARARGEGVRRSGADPLSSDAPQDAQ
jgi:hypothetical protein